MTHQQWVLGIDGGGTKTEAILVATDGTLGTGESAGPSNLNRVGIERVAELIVDLARNCCQKISCPPEDLQAVGIGLAGAGRAADRARLQSELEEAGRKQHFPIKSIVVETDWRIALEAAFASGPGMVLIAGTGSIACAKGGDGTFFRAGGWGTILGDEGSGYAIGRDAVKAALRSHDGRGRQTTLHGLALQHFSVSSIEEVIGKVYHEQADVASFVPKVLQAASKKDEVAQGILSDGAAALAELVHALMTRIQTKRKFPLALMGGLLEKENVYSTMVKEKITSSLPQVLLQKPKFPAVYGAAILALQPFAPPA